MQPHHPTWLRREQFETKTWISNSSLSYPFLTTPGRSSALFLHHQAKQNYSPVDFPHQLLQRPTTHTKNAKTTGSWCMGIFLRMYKPLLLMAVQLMVIYPRTRRVLYIPGSDHQIAVTKSRIRMKLLKTSCFFGKEKFLPIPQPLNLPVLTRKILGPTIIIWGDNGC